MQTMDVYTTSKLKSTATWLVGRGVSTKFANLRLEGFPSRRYPIARTGEERERKIIPNKTAQQQSSRIYIKEKHTFASTPWAI
jgi:hypothetical protein